MRPSIVVIPVVYPGEVDTECVDPSSGVHRVETWLTQDVPAWADSHLRTIAKPVARATLGYSAGGWCASMLSVRHPDFARTSISLAGYFVVEYDPQQVLTSPHDPAYDLPDIVAAQRPAVDMYFYSGAQDPYTQPSLGRMQRAVAAPTSLTVVRSKHGGHLPLLWRQQLPHALTWLAGHETQFAAKG